MVVHGRLHRVLLGPGRVIDRLAAAAEQHLLRCVHRGRVRVVVRLVAASRGQLLLLPLNASAHAVLLEQLLVLHLLLMNQMLLLLLHLILLERLLRLGTRVHRRIH